MEQEDVEQNSKIAALVESNCEFLIHVRHNANNRTDLVLNSCKTLEEYMEDRKCKLNNEAFIQLLVELTYFYYACKNFKVMPAITPKDVRIEQSNIRNSQKRFSVVVWYKLMDKELEEGAVMTGFVPLIKYLHQQLEGYLSQRKEERDRPVQQQEHQQAIQTYFGQFLQVVEAEFYQENQSQFFHCLEQANLFYEYSLFYRIKNCSTLDFIKGDQPRFRLFQISKVKDESLVIEYNKEKNRGKCEQEVLRGKEREIELNISQFFKAINEKNYFEIQAKNEKDQAYRVKFNYTIREREKFAFEQVIRSMQASPYNRSDCKKLIQSKRPISEIEYFIEYSSQKNHICVKLYNPSIVSNVQTSDFLIFQSNVLTFDPVNVSIELSEPKLKGQEKTGKKVVTFKGSSSFNVKEPPLEKILLLMDITMIASKVYEPELNLNRYGSALGKDYQRLATVSNKISHYTKMFLKLAKKIYSE